MPTCRRKRVVLTEPSPALLQAAQSNLDKEVYYLHQTGEIFESYEAYAARVSFYRLKQFQCEVTGKSGLDYFQALESEQQEAQTMHSRFPEPLKAAVLKAVQWQVVGRLDHLVEAVFERFKDRYFADEKVFVDVQGDKFYAKVLRVYPPKPPSEVVEALSPNQASSSTSPVQTPPAETSSNVQIHKIGGDLKIPVKEAHAKDDPLQYIYQVQILEETHDKSHEKGKAVQKDKGQWSGRLLDVRCNTMSRDRLAFSKSILRRFIRDCVDRDAAVASPWTVKEAIAKHYGVDSIMPEETRRGVENIKKGEIDKRKKIWEDKEGPPSKKQKKLTAAQEERVTTLTAGAEKRERETREKVERQHKAKEEAERLAAERKKKKPIRYPTEDLDVRISDKEKKAGSNVKKPIPSRVHLPFGEDQVTFESFLMAWNFLVVYGQPLHISPLTMDDFEHALRHSTIEPPCPLLCEIHATLIYNLRTVPFNRHSAVLSLLRVKDTLEEEHKILGITIDQLAAAMADVGNNWERVPLRAQDARAGWEDALIGCLKDHATLENFPRLREVLTRLLFAPEPNAESSPCSTSSRDPTPVSYPLLSTPGERYHALPPPDRIAVLAFLCNLSVSSKTIHIHMEGCEESLTALRKEKIEINRLKKQYTEEMNTLVGEVGPKKEATPAGTEEDIATHDSSDLSDAPSEEGSDTTSRHKVTPRQKDLRQRAHAQAHAKQREIARAKVAAEKQAQAEHRRLDEEVNKLERRLESIEREFRKLFGAIRAKPLGKDRFHNRVWWFDGMGSMSLLGSGGVVQYGTGRIFIQGPTEMELELMSRREENDVDARREEEEGEGLLGPGEWAVYTELEEVDEFVAWLNPKGVRELALKNAFTKWWNHVAPGMRKRLSVRFLVDGERISRLNSL
ncbi:chromatin remodeling complex protein [Boletus reticuloceps]|uniref:Chromatin remodeling complex protein n=1 Tax=Boletus reticuloceps TaxID=495285 RepID=A0A8I2YXW5_9AGAM|nr:chromatin remodeling complex protein [Boletus reticuloceps]